ncbi:MAG: hypothetical protein GY870_09190 [archaeon]|nr:hypothetical protein [archaeon]
MNDLIYGGNEYKEEIIKLFPKAKIQDASDEIHEDRISIDVNMGEEEYFRNITLNGFHEMSIGSMLIDKKKVKKWMKKWKKDYPQYFK